jgi:hypothetical protein
MDFVMSPGGLLLHARQDWPCAICRSDVISESHGYCLCRDCAYAIVRAAEAGEAGARALLDDITDALSLLEAQRLESHLVTN